MAARARVIAEVEALNTRRFYIILAGIVGAGVVALLLSAIGLYAVVARLRALITATGEEFPTVTLPPVTAIAAFGVLAVAGAAVWIPARRAASVDPAVTLRSE